MRPSVWLPVVLGLLLLVVGLPGPRSATAWRWSASDAATSSSDAPAATVDAAGDRGPAGPASGASVDRSGAPDLASRGTDIALGTDLRECKPRGPIELGIRVSGQPDGRLVLAFDIRPVCELEQLSWHLELPPGTQLVEGGTAGSAVGRAGERTLGAATVRIPAGSLAGGELSLVATGLFRAHADAPAELLDVRRTVWWGDATLPGIATRVERSSAGAQQSTAPVPVAHRPGS